MMRQRPGDCRRAVAGVGSTNQSNCSGERLLQIRRANSVIEQIALPWDRLFRAVESAAVERVMVLGIAPDAKSGTVQINAETADAEAMFEYVRRLEQQPELANVYLLQHQFERQNVARPLQFLVTASWLEGIR